MGVTRRIVVVTGGRSYPEDPGRWRVHDKLAEMEPTLVVQGGAPDGADRWARRWALHTGTPVVTVHALWDHYKKAAGPIRNRWMYEIFNVFETLAFPGGAGTANCTEESLRYGVPVWKCGDSAPEYMTPGPRPPKEDE